MTPFGFLIALVIALFGIGLIKMDMERRELPKQRQLRWTGVASGVILSGFLLPYLHTGVYEFALHALYGSPEPAIARTPFQLDMPILVAGLLTTVGIGVTYGIGSRVPLSDR